MKTLTLCLLTLSIVFSIHAQDFGSITKSLSKKIGVNTEDITEEEAGSGLKEALNQGIRKGVTTVSKPDGYFKDPVIKILLPEEAKEVEKTLRKTGQGKLVDDAIESLNRAAEDAATQATDIFIAAIKQMTIEDAFNILRGEDDAATSYLKKTTRADLVRQFRPVIKASLDKVDATKYWNTMFSTYNKVPFVTKVNPDLEEYATNKAIDGLFVQIAKEELNIRKNPEARVSDLLKKVFG